MTSPQSRPVRVALYGNICNNLYQIAKMLRAFPDIDAHLFIDETSDIQQRPESDDPSLRNRYPPWIHEGRYSATESVLAPWTSPLVQELASFDMAVLSGLGPLFAPFLKVPTAFLVSGGDLTIFPFPWRFRFQYPSLKSKAWSWMVGFWQRRGIRRCGEIWAPGFAPFSDALQALSVEPGRVSRAYFPLVIDLERFQRQPAARRDPRLFVREVVDRFDFVVFHPSRLMIRDLPELKATGQWKRNEVLFQGFATFLKQSGARRAGLVMPDRTDSPDVDLAKQIIASLGIQDHVLWLKPPRPFGFTREELVPLYSVSDVAADDFGVGWFGSVVLEALACRCPVVTYVDERMMSQLYPWHPLFSARSPDAVAQALETLYRDPTKRGEKAEAGRKWVEEFHSEEAAARAYASHIRGLRSRLAAGQAAER
jgi:glycosyltransferase involved in cell wall biosynthesis